MHRTTLWPRLSHLKWSQRSESGSKVQILADLGTYSCTEDDGLNEVYYPDDDEAKAEVGDASDEVETATKFLHFGHLGHSLLNF